MRTILLFMLIIGFCYGQVKQLDWSNITINFPTAKDDTNSVVYADSGEIIKALYINRMNRIARKLEDKIGLGNSIPSAPGQKLEVASDGSTTTWAMDTSYFQWQILAPTVAYQKGDSLLFVKSIQDEDVYYDLGKVATSFNTAMKIDSIWILYKGDVSSYVDSLKLYSVVDNSVSNMILRYAYIMPAQCNGSNQIKIYPVNFTIEPNQPLLLRIWYDVSSYIYTMHFRIFTRST